MNEPKPLPSETKLVELSDEGAIDAVFDRLAAEERTIRRYKLLTPEVEAKIADLESALASLADELRLAREALKQAAEMLQASLPYWQTDERGNGPDCTPVLQAILKANAALKEPL